MADGRDLVDAATEHTRAFRERHFARRRLANLVKPRPLAVDVLFTTENVGDKTIATLTFEGDQTEYGSLVDGNYQLTILADRVHDRLGGLELDGDGDGISGGDHVFGADEVDAFFRFFGDFDGDNRDFLKFHSRFHEELLFQ